MSFESLPNELLFDVFDYLSSVDLFHSFNSLNVRFDNLLIEYISNNKLIDFRLISKEDLNLIRRRYLSSFINEIDSIYLSDNDTNPTEIDLFLSRLYPLYRFKNLESIKLFNIYSVEKMIRILNDLQQISSLKKLHFCQCYCEYDPKNLVILFNKIWSLPNLSDCCLDLCFPSSGYLITPTIISCSIEYLIIRGFRFGLENLRLLSEHTPYVKTLTIDCLEDFVDDQPLSLIESLTKLKLKCHFSSTLILSLLRKLPNLNDLTIEMKNINMDGHMWQTLINRYLPHLKIFNLKMKIEYDDTNDIQDEIDRLIDSFKTKFWIDQHQWFIRAFSYSKNQTNIIHLHTLPYKFKHFSIDINETDCFLYKSTSPNDNHYLTYNYVDHLNYSTNISDQIDLTKFQFTNLKELILTLPYDDSFLLNVPRFDSLIYLQVRMTSWGHNNNELVQLQHIIDQAPNLYYLKFHTWSSSLAKTENKNKKNTNPNTWKMAPFSIRSSSVRYLDLRGYTQTNDNHYYNDQQCSALIRSPLAQQCQYLVIEVEKRTNIIDLVNKINSLRTLNVRCRDRKKNDYEIMKWLQQHLPSTCSIAKDSKHSEDIRLWIR